MQFFVGGEEILKDYPGVVDIKQIVGGEEVLALYYVVSWVSLSSISSCTMPYNTALSVHTVLAYHMLSVKLIE